MPDLRLGRLGHGAANVGNLYRAITDDEAWRILETAWDCGVRYFDTAPHYGLGLSERRLGAFLATKPREEFVLSTKVGRLLRPNPAGAGRLDEEHDFAVPADRERVWDVTADGLRRSMEESLGRLGLGAVDVLYLHDPERFDLRRGIEEGLPALAKLRDEGLVRAVGVGSMSTEALLASVRSGVPDLLMVAGRLTLADQEVAVHPVATLALARRGDRFEIRWERVVREIAARTHDHGADHARNDVGLGEQTGELPIPDHEVVRPLQPRLEPGDVVHRARKRAAGGHRRRAQRGGSQRRSQQHRDEQRRAGCGDPRSPEPAPARGLVVGHGHHPGRRPRARFVEQIAVGGVDRVEPPHVPARVTSGGRFGHRP